MTQKQLTALVLATFLLTVGVLIALSVGDLTKRNVSNPIEKALQQKK